jgi:membrane protein involved in colicin uptake
MTRLINFTIHLVLFGLLIWENKSEACGMYGTDEDHIGEVSIGDRMVLK